MPMQNISINKQNCKPFYNCAFGLSGLTEDNQHIFMLDADIEHNLFTDLKAICHNIQEDCCLSNIYIIQTTNGFNILSFDKLDLSYIPAIGGKYKIFDKDFYKIGFDWGYYDLRMDKDKRLIDIVVSRHNVYQKSNAHREFFNMFFNVNIKKDNTFDDYKKVDLIEFVSDKHGYFKDNKLDDVELYKNMCDYYK